MSNLDRVLDSKDQTIKSLTLSIFLTGSALLTSIYFQYKSREGITVHYPPDLSKVTRYRANEIPNHTVFSFTYAVFQKLNTWEHNGETDFPEKINMFRNYMTYEFKRKMDSYAKLKRSKGELNKVRHFTLYPGRNYTLDRVKKTAEHTWVVYLDALVKEYVNGMHTKVIAVRYPIIVTYYDIDFDKNPWKLAIAGYADKGPRPIKYNRKKFGVKKINLTSEY